MRTIHKYKLKITNEQIIDMPAHAAILSVGTDQFNNVCLWAMVETDNPPEPRKFSITGTGNHFPGPETPGNVQKFLGTAVQSPFVWHVFEEKLNPILRSMTNQA
jgi:hypothetical protein